MTITVMAFIDISVAFIRIGPDDGSASAIFISFLIINLAFVFLYIFFEEKTKRKKMIYGILIGMAIFGGFMFLARNGII